jgi:hypothetical protein
MKSGLLISLQGHSPTTLFQWSCARLISSPISMISVVTMYVEAFLAFYLLVLKQHGETTLSLVQILLLVLWCSDASKGSTLIACDLIDTKKISSIPLPGLQTTLLSTGKDSSINMGSGFKEKILTWYFFLPYGWNSVLVPNPMKMKNRILSSLLQFLTRHQFNFWHRLERISMWLHC